MAAGPPAADSIHGATEIQKNFAARSRLIVGAVAAGIAVAIAAQLTTGDFVFPIATVGAGLSVVALVVGLLQGRGSFLPTGLLGLGSIALLEVLHGSLATFEVPFIGGAMLAAAEFGYWSFELQITVRRGGTAILNRVGAVLGLVVAGTALSGAAFGLVQVLR
jgi:hypothetical protein